MKQKMKDFKNYLQSMNKSTNTIKTYERNLKEYTKFLEEKNMDYTEVDYNFVNNFMLFLTQKGNKTSSRNQKLATLKSFYKFLRLQQVIIQNPLEFVETAKQEQKLPSYLTKHEITAIVEECKRHEWRFSCCGQRNQLIISLLLNCGFRVSEVSNIKLGDINFERNYIKVTGKGSKERIVGFSEDVARLLQQYIDDNKDMNRYLLLSRKGGKLTERQIRNVVKEIVKAVLPHERAAKISVHSLRHTCATMLYEKDTDIFVIQSVLGHSSPSTTRIYTHIANEKVLAATQNLKIATAS